uniref:F-box domain-containing protein n=1 Tax=viral metagenome TaxID=1070528 RepID=A0A6C0CH12_9ZZZZ
MDPVEKNIEAYVGANFESIPEDVLHALLATMDPASMIALCTANPKLKKACSMRQEAATLDLAAARYIAEEAPLAQPIRSLADQANLIKRGYCTTYSCGVLLRSRYTALKVGFGPKTGSSSTARTTNFSIKGMPPAQGTKVWITGRVTSTPDGKLESGNATAFESQEAAILYAFEGWGGYLHVSGKDGELEELELKLRNREIIGDRDTRMELIGKFVLEVTLP